MKLLIDQNLPEETAVWLRGLGHDALSAAEIGMERASDDALIQFAREDSRVIATLDGDTPKSSRRVLSAGPLSSFYVNGLRTILSPQNLSMRSALDMKRNSLQAA